MSTISTNTGLVEAATEALIALNIADALPKVNVQLSTGLTKGDTYKFPIVSGVAGDFVAGTNGYTTGAGEASYRSVVLNKHAKSSFNIKQEDGHKFQYANLVKGAMEAIVAKIKADIYGEFKAANFTNDDVIGTSANFDYAAFAAAQSVGDTYNLTPGERSLVLAPAYVNALVADASVANALSISGQLTGKMGELQLLDTRIVKATVPSAGNVVGVIHDKNALCVAFGAPALSGKAILTEVMDDKTGFKLFVREVEDVDSGDMIITVEAVYGLAKGLDTASLLKSA